MADMRLGIVAEYKDRASKRLQKLLKVNERMEKANRAQAKLARSQVKSQTKLAAATSRLQRLMSAVKAAASGVSAPIVRAAAAMARFTGHVSTAIRKVFSLRAALDRTRRGAALMGKGLGRIASGAVIAGGLALGGAGLAAGAANMVIGPAAQVENYMVQLESLEGSSARAKAAMAWITDFAVRTPLELPQVIESYRQLKTFGIDPTNGSMQALVDTMAMSGGGAEELSGIVLAVGQAWTKGKLQGEEAMQLLERGVPVWDLLSKATGKTAAQLMDLASKGELGRDVIAKLVELMGERAVGASEKMSKTWDGMVRNMSDMWFKFRLMIAGAGVFDWAKGKLQNLLATINAMAADGGLLTLAQTISQNIITTLEAIWRFGLEASRVLSELGIWLSYAADMLGGWNNLATVLIGLPLASTILSVVTGFALLASGLATVSAGALGLVSSGALAAVRLFLVANIGAYRLIYAGTIKAVTGVTALGRALVTLAAASVRGAAAGFSTLGKGLAGLPALTARAAAGLRALTVAAAGLPAKLLAVALGMAATALSGLKSLPGLLAGAARGFVMISAGGLAKLPGLLLAATRAFIAFGAGLMATPVGWFIAGVAAVAGAAYLIYQNWEPIKAFFADLWAGVTQAGNSALVWMKSLDFSAVIPAISWDDVLTVLDLASWILPVRWLDLIPGFSWKEIITAVLNWADFIPLPDFSAYFDFEWTDVLPDWDWGAIIPDMPDWVNPSNWFSDGPTEVPEIATADAASLERARQSAENLDAAMAAMRGTAKSIPVAAQEALNTTNAALEGVDFTHHGARMMETIAAGMRARAHVVVAEMRKVTQALRDHLPSSPAKVGPLSDIHRLKFSETMAQSIRPGPMVAAMRRTAAATMAAASLTAPNLAGAAPNPVTPPQSALPAAAGGANTAAGNGGSGARAISITYSPSITIEGGSVDGEKLRQILRDNADELVALIRERLEEDKRLDF